MLYTIEITNWILNWIAINCQTCKPQSVFRKIKVAITLTWIHLSGELNTHLKCVQRCFYFLNILTQTFPRPHFSSYSRNHSVALHSIKINLKECFQDLTFIAFCQFDLRFNCKPNVNWFGSQHWDKLLEPALILDGFITLLDLEISLKCIISISVKCPETACCRPADYSRPVGAQ